MPMLIPPTLSPLIKTMQIIVAALMLGLATFLGIAGYLGQSNPPDPDRTPIISYIGLFLLASGVTASFVLPALATRDPLRNALQHAAADAGLDGAAIPDRHWLTLLTIRQTRMILGLAPLEGAGFFNCIAYIVEGNPVALGGAIGALVAMAMRFPTFASVAAWLQQQKEAVAALRNRGPDSLDR